MQLRECDSLSYDGKCAPLAKMMNVDASFFHGLSSESRAESKKWVKLCPWKDSSQPLGNLFFVVLILQVSETERRSDSGITHKLCTSFCLHSESTNQSTDKANNQFDIRSGRC